MIQGHGLCRLEEEAVDEKEEDPSGWEQKIKMYNIEQTSPTIIAKSW